MLFNDDEFVEDVKAYAEAQSRSVPKQIEYWAKIERIAEDNPDLPFSFIKEIMLAKSEIRNQKSEIRNQKSEIRNQKSESRNGRMAKYVRRQDRSAD